MFSGMRPGGNSAIRRVVWAQLVLLLPGAGVGTMLGTLETGIAVGYGMLVALSISLVLFRREQQAMRHPEWDQHRLFKLFVLTGFERLLVLVALLAIGLVVLKLPPLPQLLGLLLAQFAWLAVVKR